MRINAPQKKLKKFTTVAGQNSNLTRFYNTKKQQRKEITNKTKPERETEFKQKRLLET